MLIREGTKPLEVLAIEVPNVCLIVKGCEFIFCSGWKIEIAVF